MSPKKFKNPREKYDFKGRTCSITGVGSYVPSRVVTNADLEEIVETTDEWITSRTGIKARRIASADEYTSDLAANAALRAMKMAGVKPEEIDLIIVATITPDMPFPSTACVVQQKIGAYRAAAFDIEAACSGSTRRSCRRLWTGRTGTRACCSGTERARRFCTTVRIRTDC